MSACYSEVTMREIKVEKIESEDSDSGAGRPRSAPTTAKTRAATPGRRKPAARKRRVAVFIDGSNLYFKLRTLIPNKMDFIHYHYQELVQGFLQADERLVYAGYYVGVVRDTKRTKNHDKTLELVKNQQKLFEQLRYGQLEIVKGYLLERDGKYFEKGVDVRLAVDIVTMAQAKTYDVAVVVSSDTDLLPAMRAAQRLKKTIVHVGFEHQPSLALIRQADRSHLVSRREAERYIAPPLAINRYDD
jgi:uncharacterized LabA/DUF88 family protein